MLAAAFEDVRTSESLALDMWNEFICKENVTPSAVRDLAKVIRDNNYQLLPVFRTIMKSKAVFAPQNRNCLIKHPVDLLVGFLRSTEIPVLGNRPYADMDSWLNDMGQRPLSPATIFGWDETKLAGEAYTLEWRNAILELVNKDNYIKHPTGNYQIREEVFYRTKFLAGAEGSAPLIDKISTTLGVQLNVDQKATLYRYMRNDYNCPGNDNTQCHGEAQYLEDKGEPATTVKRSDAKVRGLISLIAMLPEYRLK